MSFFVLGSLLCLSKYNITNNNSLFNYEPLVEPFKILRLTDRNFSVSTYFVKNGTIYMNGAGTFNSSGKRRWEVLSENEIIYTNHNKTLIHKKGLEEIVIKTKINIFTLDHIEHAVFYVLNESTLVRYDLRSGGVKYSRLTVPVRDIECSGGTCLLYGIDYSIWYKNKKIGSTKELAVIPFLALEKSESLLIFWIMLSCVLLIAFFCICFQPHFLFQLFLNKVGSVSSRNG